MSRMNLRQESIPGAGLCRQAQDLGKSTSVPQERGTLTKAHPQGRAPALHRGQIQKRGAHRFLYAVSFSQFWNWTPPVLACPCTPLAASASSSRPITTPTWTPLPTLFHLPLAAIIAPNVVLHGQCTLPWHGSSLNGGKSASKSSGFVNTLCPDLDQDF